MMNPARPEVPLQRAIGGPIRVESWTLNLSYTEDFRLRIVILYILPKVRFGTRSPGVAKQTLVFRGTS